MTGLIVAQTILFLTTFFCEALLSSSRDAKDLVVVYECSNGIFINLVDICNGKNNYQCLLDGSDEAYCQDGYFKGALDTYWENVRT